MDYKALRTGINAVRALPELPPFGYAEVSDAKVSTIKLAHMLELRSALDSARSTVSLPPVGYFNSVLTTASPVSANDVNDLRNGVK